MEMRRRIFKIVSILGLPIATSIYFYTKLAACDTGDDDLRQKMDWLYAPGEKPDILFLGSSRVLNLVDPRVIDSVCGTKSYNLGLYNWHLAEMRMQLRVCLETGKVPHIIVFNLDPASFDVRDPVYSFTDVLAYAAKDSVVYNSMSAVQDVYVHKWKYPFYRLQKLTAVNDGVKVKDLWRSEDAICGEVAGRRGKYEPMSVSRGFSPDYEKYSEIYVAPYNEKFDEMGFELLRDMIRLCRNNGIKPVFVTAPMYKDYRTIYLNAEYVLSRAGEVAREEGVPYFNMIDDSMSLHKENFYNFVHLNGWAAERYSLRLAVILRSMDKSCQAGGNTH